MPSVPTKRTNIQQRTAVKTADPAKELNKLEELAQIDNKALFSCTTQFPFTIFPTVVTVDRNKVTIRDYFFFISRQIYSLHIQNIMTIAVSEALLFSQIELVHTQFPDEKIKVNYLSKDDARKFQLIVQGLIVADKEGIDMTAIPHSNLIDKLEQVGHTAVSSS